MSNSTARTWWVLAVVWLCGTTLWAAQVKNRSTSRTGQFIVYCDDRDIRYRVVSYAEELKGDMLQILDEQDTWSTHNPPIVVTIDPAAPEEKFPPVQVRWVNTVAGAKIDVIVRYGEDLGEVFLQRHLLRALLLELSYRGRAVPEANKPYADPPWWLAEGIIETIRMREDNTGSDVFKSIVNTEKLPSLDSFLSRPPVHLDVAGGTVDRACAMCMVQALLDLPHGASNLMRFLQAWPDANGDVRGALTAQFPALAESEQSLAKWWALQLARYAKGDRFSGMSLADTNQQFESLLSFDLQTEPGRTQKFNVTDFEAFIKYPSAKAVMQAQQVRMVTLMTTAHPLFRPILTEYEEIFSQLCQRKTKQIAARLEAIEHYRSTILKQISDITDYLNWYEATQPVGRTGVFDPFLRRAEKLEAPVPVDPRVTDYLDALEQDFAPVAPSGFPGLTPAGSASR